MPYVITVKHLTPDGLGVTRPNEVKAVATLEEAQGIAWNAVTAVRDTDPVRFDRNCAAAHNLSEQGGSIDLPDGSRVEVEQRNWDYIWRNTERWVAWSVWTKWTPEKRLAAFNQAQEGR